MKNYVVTCYTLSDFDRLISVHKYKLSWLTYFFNFLWCLEEEETGGLMMGACKEEEEAARWAIVLASTTTKFRFGLDING
mmetsp:Transcript_8649/g.10549  ORF Transcript_8649/g.10549 Transcript_8649/m.10549 type:complete len:80 (+) Transcript_8649:516-755(+)